MALRTKTEVEAENVAFFLRALTTGLVGGSVADFVIESMRARMAQERLFTRDGFGSILCVDATALCADGGFVTDLYASLRDSATKVASGISGYLNSRVMVMLDGPEQLRLEVNILEYWGDDPSKLEIDPLSVPAHMPLGRRAKLTLKEV